MAGVSVQVLFETDLTDEEYVTRRAWNLATAPRCPWCRRGTCELRPHGTYPRRRPAGAQVRRFVCRKTGRTVSLLPLCLAAHVSGSLDGIEEAVRQSREARSFAAAARQARPAEECGPAGAERWLRRRVGWLQEVLRLVRGLYPAQFGGAEETLEGFERHLGSRQVLRELRTVAKAHLPDLPAPVGFQPRRRGVRQ